MGDVLRKHTLCDFIPGGASRITVFADALDRALSLTSLRVRRVGAYEWRLRMGLGVKGSLRLSRANGDLQYEVSLELSRIPLLLSIAVAAISLIVSIFFFFFGFLFIFFFLPLVIGFWNVERAEREVLEALETARLQVFGEAKPRRRPCPVCGFESPEWAVYCTKCGAKL